MSSGGFSCGKFDGALDIVVCFPKVLPINVGIIINSHTSECVLL
jgi:hypothetical protein